MKLADKLSHSLVKERRSAFEQELDKQLKTFVVEVIQFRNAFDAQGPAVPGVRPAEAVVKLQDFQNRLEWLFFGSKCWPYAPELLLKIWSRY